MAYVIVGNHSHDHKLLHNLLKAMELFMKDTDRRPEIPDDPEPLNENFHGDNRIQKECVYQFGCFKKSIHELDHRLDEFMRAVRSVGSSSQLILSTIELQRRMTDILEVFRSNAMSIYNGFAESASPELPDIFQSNSPHRTQKSSQDQKPFPELLADISEELGNFLKSLSDIPEFSDKKLTDSILAFEGWLIYRTGSLEDIQDQSQTRAMERYENSLMLEMIHYMRETGKALAHFAKDGVIAIKEAQDRSKEQLLNMSTVATFFSGVAATTFQYTSTEENSPLGQAVRALWVSSLILSIASAINSQLAMHWRSAMYRSPRSALPMWTLLCLNHTPLLFLVAAVLTFSIGLVGYTYSSTQGKLVTLSATALTSFTSLILLTVIVWEGGERWQASKFRRKGRWVDGRDLVNEPWQPYSNFKRFNAIIIRVALKSTRRLCLILLIPLGLLLGWISSCLQRLASAGGDRTNADEESKRLPPPAVSPERVIPELTFHNPSNSSLETSSIKIQPRFARRSTAPPGISQLKVETGNNVDEALESPPQTPGATARTSEKERFNKNAVRLIRSPASREKIKSVQMSPYESKTLRTVEPVSHLRPARGLGDVHDLIFSPDGKWLAASFANQWTEVWAVGDDFTRNAQFNTQPSCINWSPDSRYILAKQKDGVLIWSPNAGQKTSISRKKFEAIAWLSDGKDFAAIHERQVYIISGDTGATESRRTLSSRPLRMHDIASVPTASSSAKPRRLIIAVGSVQDQPWNEEIYQRFISLSFKFLSAPWQAMPVRPDDVQPQRRILIYDIDNQRVAAVVPVWGDARHVSVSRNGKYALVSYAAAAPPELWRIRISEQGSGAASLELYHLYLPTTGTTHTEGIASTTEFVGQARFGGEEDEYVVATTKKGEVYIWDTYSSELCHFVKDVRDGSTSQLMGIAWCPTNEERRVPMFGCGLGETEIVIWKGKGQDPSAEGRVVVELESDAPRPASSDAYVGPPKDKMGSQGLLRTQNIP
ncbi:hypothetical protein M407DRAFT_26893 [Tulasnella calospora MUT 4182]|uniref:Uncharacterized protein n=1 Tax=Tulasnella calospora MUT 4182 TaxID=1051891 RepID=A0A0C3QDI6_9AGAM|nr:hypothetical protein M407DRAFT_26893 [Tulasnella calospora MUT 4182]